MVLEVLGGLVLGIVTYLSFPDLHSPQSFTESTCESLQDFCQSALDWRHQGRKEQEKGGPQSSGLGTVLARSQESGHLVSDSVNPEGALFPSSHSPTSS